MWICGCRCVVFFFFFKQKTAYEIKECDWSSDVCSSDLSGMRRYMKDLKPTGFEDLVALVALYRPGPLEMGMVPKYINRKHGREKVSYLHPKLEPILKNTYGIGVYQEQMMKIATDLAGYTLPEADTLRKAIGKKIKKLLDEQEEKLVSGMIKNGIDEKTARKIWDLYPPFARYGFNRSHAVAYALIGYQTAYLKANYPVELMTAIFNATGDVERISFLINEAQHMGIKVLQPDVNSSMSRFVPEGKNIRFGISSIKNIGEKITEAIVDERLRNGPYESLTGFAKRTKQYGLNKKVLESLIKTGALDSLGVDRMTALENVDLLLKAAASGNNSQSTLFGDANSFEITLKPASTPSSKTEKLAWEKELMGLYVTEHPLKAYLEKNGGDDMQSISDALSKGNNRTVRICGVISKMQRFQTKTGTPMLFVTLEDLSDNIEMLVFSEVLKKYSSLWVENNSVLISGKISKRNGDTKLICQTVQIINL